MVFPTYTETKPTAPAPKGQEWVKVGEGTWGTKPTAAPTPSPSPPTQTQQQALRAMGYLQSKGEPIPTPKQLGAGYGSPEWASKLESYARERGMPVPASAMPTGLEQTRLTTEKGEALKPSDINPQAYYTIQGQTDRKSVV